MYVLKCVCVCVRVCEVYVCNSVYKCVCVGENVHERELLCLLKLLKF